MRQALAWMYDPANRTDAAGVLAGGRRSTSPPQPRPCRRCSIKYGIARTGAIEPDGVKTVLALRAAYTQKNLTDPLKYYDPSYFGRSSG